MSDGHDELYVCYLDDFPNHVTICKQMANDHVNEMITYHQECNLETPLFTVVKYIRADLVKPTMTVERAREILKDNPNVFIFENGSIDLARDKTKICLGEETYTAEELEAIVFLMRNNNAT